MATETSPQTIIDVLKSLDQLLAPREGVGGPGLTNLIMNYPNLSKVRRVIGGDDSEINELLMQKNQRASRWVEEGQARHREEWKAKLRYHKERGKLTMVEQQVHDILKNGGHWYMQDILAKFAPEWTAVGVPRGLNELKESFLAARFSGLITQVENILHELERRGLIVQTTNHINRKPEEPYRHKWFVVSKDERRIFAGLKPSATYTKNTPKLEVRRVNVKEELEKSKMHAS